MTTLLHRPLVAGLVLLSCIWQMQAGPIICDGSTAEVGSSETSTEAPKPSDVNKFLHNVQCTLEKAKPWIEDLEKEAKKLEETAKRVGLSIINRFENLMDTLLGAANRRSEPECASTEIPKETVSVSSLSKVTATVQEKHSSSTEAAKQVTTESPLGSPDDNNDVENEIFNVEAGSAKRQARRK